MLFQTDAAQQESSMIGECGVDALVQKSAESSAIQKAPIVTLLSRLHGHRITCAGLLPQDWGFHSSLQILVGPERPTPFHRFLSC